MSCAAVPVAIAAAVVAVAANDMHVCVSVCIYTYI